jgi:hypothetical protein
LSDAELVVVAKVKPAAATAPLGLMSRFLAKLGVSANEGEARDGRTIAKLQVLETWKGQAVSEVTVRYRGTLICPAPPHFEEGQTVLTFLSNEKGGTWAVVGLSYGTLYPEADELPVLRQATKEILSLPPGDVAAETELLINLASRRATRWDGLFELVPEGDRLHDFYRREQPRGDASKLTGAQLARVAAAFIKEPSVDQSLPMTLLLLAGFPDRDFDRTVVGVIDAMVVLESLPYWFEDALHLAMARLAPGETPPTLDPTAPVVPEAFRKLWEPFRAGLDLDGPIPKIDLPLSAAHEVGPQTPP